MTQSIAVVGYVAIGAGIIVFTVLFLTCVRWWSDVLGWTIAAVCFMFSLTLGLGIYRLFGGPLPGGTLLWSAILYPAIAVVVWSAAGTFIWSQFVARRVRRKNRAEKQATEVR